jgi:hypothetical protein
VSHVPKHLVLDLDQIEAALRLHHSQVAEAPSEPYVYRHFLLNRLAAIEAAKLKDGTDDDACSEFAFMVSEVGGVRKLEDVRLHAILNSLDSAAHPPAVGPNLCALTEVPLILQLGAQVRLQRYFPPQSVDFLLTGHSPSPSSSLGMIPCPCPPSGRSFDLPIGQLEVFYDLLCDRVLLLVGERPPHIPNAGKLPSSGPF